MADAFFLPLLLLLLLAAAANLPLSTPKTFPGDKEALRQLKAGIAPSSIPPGSCLHSWNFSFDPCDSLFSGDRFTCGFRCDATSAGGLSRVTDVTLDAAAYSGGLSPSVWSLPFLLSLDLPDNRLSGRIPLPPPRSSPLSSLRRITLSRNAFSGGIPPFSSASFPALEELFLDGNRLSGPIPAAISSLQSLKRLEIQGNKLTGSLPSDLSTLGNLVLLDASDNGISGAVPPALPPSLLQLSARNNQIEGTLPPQLGSLPYLQVIDLSNNRLTGAVPASLFRHESLEQLVLSNNKFTSLEPPGWGGGSSGLVELDMGHNELSGYLPMWLVAAMPRLSALSLEGNRYAGLIPWAFAARPLARLILAGNYLYGPIPSPWLGLSEGAAVVSLADNCLFRCPAMFFFCQGREQKTAEACKAFNPFIP